jgi:hypothetical protein
MEAVISLIVSSVELKSDPAKTRPEKIALTISCFNLSVEGTIAFKCL